MLKRYIGLSLVGVAGVLLVLYAGDFLVLRIKVRSGNAFGSIPVHRFYAVPQKSGRVEFLSADSQPETCTHSLFPQMGNLPCWYVARHTEQQINM